MSKSSGGGGLKGHDKGGGGSRLKVIKQQQSLEAALEKVPDVILCPKEHRMKLHSGSKREGRLTCDGPDDICCGVDGEGILEVGDLRYSCVECDFDICPSCVDTETKEPLTPEQEKAAARQRLREKLGRGSGKCKEHAEEAKQQAAKRAAVEAAVAEAKAEAAAEAEAEAEAKAEAKAEAAAEAGSPSEAEGAGAQAAKKKAAAARKKQAQKQRRAAKAAGSPEAAAEAEAEAGSPPAASPPAASLPVAAAAAEAAAAAAGGEASTPPVAAKPFAFNLCTPPATKLQLNTPPAPRGARLADSSDEESSDDEAEGAASMAAVGAEAEAKVAAEAAAAISEDGLLKAPENPLYCPFTQRIMRDPVVLADGHTYERGPAEKYLAQFGTSPRTGEKLPSKAVLPNLMARELCQCAMQLEL